MSILIKNKVSFDLTEYNREDLIQKIKQSLLGRVDEAYFFGSFANQDHTAESDIDLILVGSPAEKFSERNQKFSDLLDIFPRIDILVYTKKEFDLLLSQKKGFGKLIKKSLLKII